MWPKGCTLSRNEKIVTVSIFTVFNVFFYVCYANTVHIITRENKYYYIIIYDVYSFEKERASPFTSYKGKLVDYLLHVTQDEGDKSYLHQLQCDIEEGVEYKLHIWLLYVFC